LDAENLDKIQNMIAQRLYPEKSNSNHINLNMQNNNQHMNNNNNNNNKELITDNQTVTTTKSNTTDDLIMNVNNDTMSQQPILIPNNNSGNNIVSPPNTLLQPATHLSQASTTSNKKHVKDIFSDVGGDETVTDEDDILSATDREEEAVDSTAMLTDNNNTNNKLNNVNNINNMNNNSNDKILMKPPINTMKSAPTRNVQTGVSGDEITSDQDSDANPASLLRVHTQATWTDDKLEKLENEMRHQFLLLQSMTQQQQQMSNHSNKNQKMANDNMDENYDETSDVGGNNTDLNTEYTSADETEQMKKTLLALQQQNGNQ